MTPAETFTEVRKAYRLLHDYQRMVIDAIRYIERQIDMPAWVVWPHFARDSRGGCRYLSDSSWDWLPMMSSVFHFVRQEGNDFYGLTILLISDDGFIPGDNRDREDVTTFVSVDQSETRVATFLYRQHPHTFNKDLFIKGVLHDFLRDGKALPSHVTGRIYNAEQICSYEGLDMIVSELVESAKAFDFPLKLIQRSQSTSETQ
ncbi:MAG: hypothetical protein KDN18_18860 [Verrucomicrobiae bacterium]|nr:hypothetical protein [Verrucomicrobiae bacterium]